MINYSLVEKKIFKAKQNTSEDVLSSGSVSSYFNINDTKKFINLKLMKRFPLLTN